jgi:hypothetical protein
MTTKSSELQELARKRNWALYQIRSSQGNTVRAMKQAGCNTTFLETALLDAEEAVKREYARRRDRLLIQSIRSTINKD